MFGFDIRSAAEVIFLVALKGWPSWELLFYAQMALGTFFTYLYAANFHIIHDEKVYYFIRILCLPNFAHDIWIFLCKNMSACCLFMPFCPAYSYFHINKDPLHII